MALIICPECGKQVSDQSSQCIHCGYPLKQNTKCIINGTEFDLSFLFDENIELANKKNDFGKLTNQYTFHTEKALRYLKKVGVMYDRSTAGND